MNGTPTRTIYAQDADTTNYGQDAYEPNYRVADARDNLDEFAENVEEGDYLAVVYQTPSNGSSLQRVMGAVEEVERLRNGRLDDLRFTVEDGTGDGPTGDEDATAYLHLNPETGDYYFTDGRGEVPADGFPVEKWAWTPVDDE